MKHIPNSTSTESFWCNIKLNKISDIQVKYMQTCEILSIYRSSALASATLASTKIFKKYDSHEGQKVEEIFRSWEDLELISVQRKQIINQSLCRGQKL